MIARRHVYHLAGYDPIDAEAQHRRFGRQLDIFRRTWNVTASLSPARDSRTDEHAARWTVNAAGVGLAGRGGARNLALGRHRPRRFPAAVAGPARQGGDRLRRLHRDRHDVPLRDGEPALRDLLSVPVARAGAVRGGRLAGRERADQRARPLRRRSRLSPASPAGSRSFCFCCAGPGRAGGCSNCSTTGFSPATISTAAGRTRKRVSTSSPKRWSRACGGRRRRDRDRRPQPGRDVRARRRGAGAGARSGPRPPWRAGVRAHHRRDDSEIRPASARASPPRHHRARGGGAVDRLGRIPVACRHHQLLPVRPGRAEANRRRPARRQAGDPAGADPRYADARNRSPAIAATSCGCTISRSWPTSGARPTTIT